MVVIVSVRRNPNIVFVPVTAVIPIASGIKDFGYVFSGNTCNGAVLDGSGDGGFCTAVSNDQFILPAYCPMSSFLVFEKAHSGIFSGLRIVVGNFLGRTVFISNENSYLARQIPCIIIEIIAMEFTAVRIVFVVGEAFGIDYFNALNFAFDNGSVKFCPLSANNYLDRVGFSGFPLIVITLVIGNVRLYAVSL